MERAAPPNPPSEKLRIAVNGGSDRRNPAVDLLVGRRALVVGSAGAVVASMLRATIAPTLAHAGELETLLDEIARARAGVKTLRGPFTQERTVGLLATKVRSTGTFVLVRPDRLRWELAPPDDVTYWVAPEGLAYASKSGRGAIPSAGARVAAALDDLRTLLGGDLAKLRERYDLTATKTDSGEATVVATPKTPDRTLKSFSLTVAADRARPVRATLAETARDRTEIAFGALEVNAAVAPELVRPPLR